VISALPIIDHYKFSFPTVEVFFGIVFLEEARAAILSSPLKTYQQMASSSDSHIGNM